MSVATVYMTEFSDEAALKEVSEYYQNMERQPIQKQKL